MEKVLKKLSRIIIIVYLINLLTPGILNAQEQNEIQLIIRGDDLGMTQGSLEAFETAFNEGVLTCAGIQVPAPWFEGAAELCRKNPGWCIGVHLTLCGEWRGYRWRPVLPWNEVSSLVDEDGYFYRSPKELHAHKPKLKEIEAELRAQIELAKKRGIDICYLDEHYSITDNYPGAPEVVYKLAIEYDIPISNPPIPGRTHIDSKGIFGIYERVPPESKKDSVLSIIKSLESGLWLFMCHPGIDSPEQHALIHYEPEDIYEDGGVGYHRAADTDILTSIELKSIILKKNIKLTDYRELWKNQRNDFDDYKKLIKK